MSLSPWAPISKESLSQTLRIKQRGWSKNISPRLSLIYSISEEVMALANTMKLARFANGPLARYCILVKNIPN